MNCECENLEPGGYVGRLVRCPVCSLDIAISLDGHECPFLGLPGPDGLLDGARFRHPPCGQVMNAGDVQTHCCAMRESSETDKS